MLILDADWLTAPTHVIIQESLLSIKEFKSNRAATKDLPLYVKSNQWNAVPMKNIITNTTLSSVGAIALGPRLGRFEKGNEKYFRPSNYTSLVLGTFMLWWGWLGFNGGAQMVMSGGEFYLVALDPFTWAKFSPYEHSLISDGYFV